MSLKTLMADAERCAAQARGQKPATLRARRRGPTASAGSTTRSRESARVSAHGGSNASLKIRRIETDRRMLERSPNGRNGNHVQSSLAYR